MIKVSKAFVSLLMGMLFKNSPKNDVQSVENAHHVDAPISLNFVGAMKIKSAKVKIGGSFRLMPHPDGSFIVCGPLRFRGLHKSRLPVAKLKIVGLFNIQDLNIVSFGLIGQKSKPNRL